MGNILECLGQSYQFFEHEPDQAGRNHEIRAIGSAQHRDDSCIHLAQLHRQMISGKARAQVLGSV